MDEKFFLTLVEKFNTTDIAELEFSDSSTRLLLRKAGAMAPVVVAASSAPAAPASKEADAPVHLGVPANKAEKASGGDRIKSPIVATFYSAPSPDAPPFVKPGTKVKAGQTLCILEAMKMMNHLEAEFDCEIVEVHATSGQMVEYGQDLFTVKK